jgi:hypothetical protein
VQVVSNSLMAGLGDADPKAVAAAANWTGSKRRFILPLVQMVTALGLLRWSHILERYAAHRCDMPGPDPAWKFLGGVNAPVLLARLVWLRILDNFQLGPTTTRFVEDAAYIAGVGLLWFGVSLNFNRWHEQRSVFMFLWTPLRQAGDVAVVLVGMFFGLFAFDALAMLGPIPHEGVGCFGSMIWLWWVPSLVSGVLYAMWSLVLVWFFGRDFVVAVSSKIHHPPHPSPTWL